MRWQPFIDLAADTHDHEPLEDNDDRYPLLLLLPPSPAPPAAGDGPKWMLTLGAG